MIRSVRLLPVFCSIALTATSIVHGDVIDFESTPSGVIPTDNTPLTSSYVVGPTTVAFGLDLNSNFEFDGDAHFELYGAADADNVYVSAPSGNDDDNSSTGGDFFLKNDNVFVNNQSFLVEYSGVLPRQVCGSLWDLDSAERVQITVLDGSALTVATIDADVTDGGDGLPYIFYVESAERISKIQVTTVVPAALGFDNFGVFLNGPGDLNEDGIVDAADAASMFTNWGTVPPADVIADINCDHVVDAADAALTFTNWTGDSDDVAAVPEPATGLLALCFLLFAKWRRRV